MDVITRLRERTSLQFEALKICFIVFRRMDVSCWLDNVVELKKNPIPSKGWGKGMHGARSQDVGVFWR